MAAEKKMVDGVEHILNPDSPTDGSIDVHLKELWRAGGSDGDLIFGMVTQIRNDMVQAICHGVPFEIRGKVSDYEPAIQYMHRGLRIHPDGTLWILTTHGIRQPANGAMATFDVFSTDGIFTRQVNTHALVVTGFADTMITQFTSGNMTLDFDDEEEPGGNNLL